MLRTENDQSLFGICASFADCLDTAIKSQELRVEIDGG